MNQDRGNLQEKITAEELRGFGFPDEEITLARQIIRSAGERLSATPKEDEIWDCLFDAAMNDVMKTFFLRSEMFLYMKTGRECPDFVSRAWEKTDRKSGITRSRGCVWQPR